MTSSHPTARARFRAQIRRSDAQIDLTDAAFCIAEEDQAAPRSADARDELDTITAEARNRLEALDDRPRARISALNSYLFGDLGFRGNTWDYHHPSNSFLDQVVLTRIGLPITLSIVYLELGHRLGLPVEGLALPGHFLVRWQTHDDEVYVDPFRSGRIWSRSDCEQRIAAAYGGDTPALIEQVMRPPAKRDILARMLRNLKHAYVGAEDLPRALAAIERLLLLSPRDIGEVRDRGLLRARLGHLHLALDDLDTYARAAPKAADLSTLRTRARSIAGYVSPLN
ncbi:MAG TPA: transglutaminase-like domain-containing protein [Roseiflexaceae bacterium]|nr:transglutaminase-like domain-containing protein [Roseiflexaceae bacterium]